MFIFCFYFMYDFYLYPNINYIIYECTQVLEMKKNGDFTAILVV